MSDFASAMNEAIAETLFEKPDNLYDDYLEWYGKTKEFIKETLQGYFPDRWDMTHQRSTIDMSGVFNGLTKAKSKIDFTKENVGVEVMKNDKLNSKFYDRYTKIMILFPLIEIKNSANKKHIIKDLYVILYFGPFWNLLGFHGCRATKTYAEYQSEYVHSHMSLNRNPGGESNCCLGSTNYRDLESFLRSSFNELNFELLCQQMFDYLSWESTEGGPYRYMRDIKEVNNNNSVNIRNNDLEEHYKKFIKEYENFPVVLQHNPICHNFSIDNNDEFKTMVTKITDESFLLIYDEATKQSFSSQLIDNTSRVNELNNNLLRTPLFTFRNNPIYGKIEYKYQNDNKQELKKIAHSSIINHIHQTLNKKLNEYHRNKVFS